MRRDLVALFLLFSTSLAAQEPEPAGPLHPDKQRIVDEVAKKRDDMRVGARRYNVRVRVKLKNGAKLSGVVKSGRLVEREEGLDFVEADRKAPDAGIRLYYFDETTSFVFLRWVDIDSHKVVVKLSDAEVRALEHELLERERKRQAALRAARAAAESQDGPKPDGEGNQAGEGEQRDKESKDQDKGKDGKDDKDGKGGKDEKSTAEGKDGKDAHPLLAEFPPGEGWGEEKLQEIQRRKVAIGVYPNEKEKRFLEVFGEWKTQNEQAQTAAKGTAPPPGGKDKPGAPAK